LKKGKNRLNVSLPMASGQVIGVIAHETGHIQGGHLLQMREQISQATVPFLLEMLATMGSKADFPLRIEKFFLCKVDGACPECLRIIKERGDKVKDAIKSANLLGVGIKPHA
jgi:hypothetical protein